MDHDSDAGLQELLPPYCCRTPRHSAVVYELPVTLGLTYGFLFARERAKSIHENVVGDKLHVRSARQHLQKVSLITTMFSSSVQPAIVSLFSSTGSDPLSLFASRTDGSLPSDSFVCLLNDSTSQPVPEPPRALITPSIEDEDNSPNYTLDQTVLHIQSPTLQTTYIRCPPPQRRANVTSRGNAGGHLGLKHPWVHLQVRNLGREWALEVGVVDLSGREGVVRCATFQVRVPPCILTRTTQSCLRLHPEACRASSRTVRGVGVLDLTIAR